MQFTPLRVGSFGSTLILSSHLRLSPLNDVILSVLPTKMMNAIFISLSSHMSRHGALNNTYLNSKCSSCFHTNASTFHASSIQHSLHLCILELPDCMRHTEASRYSADGKATPLQAWTGLYGFRKLRPPEFLDNQHMKMARLLAVWTGRLYPRGRSLVLISFRGWVDPRAIVRPEGLVKGKILKTSSGIESANFWLVARCLN